MRGHRTEFKYLLTAGWLTSAMRARGVWLIEVRRNGGVVRWAIIYSLGVPVCYAAEVWVADTISDIG